MVNAKPQMTIPAKWLTYVRTTIPVTLTAQIAAPNRGPIVPAISPMRIVTRNGAKSTVSLNEMLSQ